MNRLGRVSLLVGVCAVLVVGNLGGTAVMDVPLVAPESIGFSAAGLKSYEQALRAFVDEQRLAGFTTLVARHGKVAAFDAYGYKDVSAKTPLTRDTIFRIASMTKPIVGVALMTLWEEGKWKLDDPVAAHIPEFKNLQVKSEGSSLVAQSHPMTMRELMSHTAGFDVSSGYRDAGLNDGDLPGMIDKLAKLPLAAQPGTDWRYGPSVDIQGYLVEKLSGQTLDRFLATRIFEPLKMKDTGFWVDPSKVDRVSRIHTYGPDKTVMLMPAPAGQPVRDPSRKPRFLSGSGGLLSTTEDYWRFAQMLLNGGQSDGNRIIKASTVELMRTNVLNEGVMLDLYGPKEPGIGFGLDFAILMDPTKANSPRGKNSFYWGGAYGTWFWIDPTNDLIVIGMIQNLNGSVPTGDTPPVRTISPKLVYEALASRGTQ
jgi:CubicO group peptidase (beta-lactamase class C family)